MGLGSGTVGLGDLPRPEGIQDGDTFTYDGPNKRWITAQPAGSSGWSGFGVPLLEGDSSGALDPSQVLGGVVIDTNGGDITTTLPDVTLVEGVALIFFHARGSGAAIIAGAGADTINGGASITMTAAPSRLIVVAYRSAWYAA